MKTIFSLILCCLLVQAATAQEASNRRFNPTTPVSYPKPAAGVAAPRTPMRLPETVDGFILLKSDFHTHTVFSDGSVWPLTRVEEAYREGLDVLAITEHLEFHYLHEPDVNATNLNREYEIARSSAEQLGILLIPGAEVTREVPAGHFNILFVEDANLLERFINYESRYDPSNLTETLQAAKEQGCFIFWNHPSYKHPQGVAEWYDLHENLYRAGLIDGLEAANSNVYIPLVQQWAIEKNLTLFSNSDYHGIASLIPAGTSRPMTIVFARERTQEGVREALENRRTVAFAQNYLYGEQSLVEGLLHGSLKLRMLSTSDTRTLVAIENLSGIPMDIQLLENDSFVPTTGGILLRGGETISVSLRNKSGQPTAHGAFAVQVNNMLPSPATPLRSELNF